MITKYLTLPVLNCEILVDADVDFFLLAKPHKQSWRKWTLDEREHEFQFLKRLRDENKYHKIIWTGL